MPLGTHTSNVMRALFDPSRSLLMRFLSGLYLMIFSFIWVWMLKSGSPATELLGSLAAAKMVGFASFFFGLFCLSPKLWTWGDARTSDTWAGISAAIRGSWYAVGGIMSLIGLALVGGAIFVLGTSGPLMAALMIFTGIAYGMGGVGLIRSPLDYQAKQTRIDRVNDPTSLVLRAAKHHRGRITPSEIAIDTHLNLSEATDLLMRMAEQRHCEERVSDQGRSFFYFPEFANPHSKRDILDDDGVVFDHEVAQAQQQARQRR